MHRNCHDQVSAAREVPETSVSASTDEDDARQQPVELLAIIFGVTTRIEEDLRIRSVPQEESRRLPGCRDGWRFDDA
jgi:hypothetical protein